HSYKVGPRKCRSDSANPLLQADLQVAVEYRRSRYCDNKYHIEYVAEKYPLGRPFKRQRKDLYDVDAVGRKEKLHSNKRRGEQGDCRALNYRRRYEPIGPYAARCFYFHVIVTEIYCADSRDKRKSKGKDGVKYGL